MENADPLNTQPSSNKKKVLPYIIAVILLLIAGGIYLQNNKSDSITQKTSPNQQKSTAEKMDFNNYGLAPDFTGIQKWLNLPAGTQTLTLSELKGKVVLIDFWTYSCINCIRTLPYVTKLYDTYKDKGLVVVGVHTPEFAFEKDTGNVQNAIKRHKINYPVAQDNNYKTWEAYENRYWPAHYLINQEGQIVYMHFGEGNYDITEKAVQQLLKLDTITQVNSASPEFMRIKSPEMYFGTDRLENLAPEQKAATSPASYTLPAKLNLNNFALQGKWKFEAEKAILTEGNGKINLRFSAGKVHMVAESTKDITLKITVDGKAQKDVTIGASMLYTLFDSEDYSEHLIEIEISNLPAGGSFDTFTFTFG